jgi:PIN domain nuclease of toxin-antitoxin system
LVVLDAWALLALLKGEAAADRVRSGWATEGAAMCSVNLGEVLYNETRRVGVARSEEAVRTARANMTVVDADWDLVSAAAAVKTHGGISYADAFCVATAQRLNVPLWTGDPEIVALDGEVEVVDLRAAA